MIKIIKKFILKKIQNLVYYTLKDQRIKSLISEGVENALVRYYHQEMFNIHNEMQRISLESSAKFVMQNIPIERYFEDRFSLIQYCLDNVSIKNGMILEFGVYKGESINFISKYIKNKNQVIYGFDSFEGLNEPWHFSKEGLFRVDSTPQLEENVVLIKGYFDESLPIFLSNVEQKCSFIHIDSDLYSSAKTIFKYLSERIVPGTIIVFDEFFNFPNWEIQEYKALNEFLNDSNYSIDFLGYTPIKTLTNKSGHQVAVQIKEMK